MTEKKILTHVVGDVYYGSHAQTYDERRSKTKRWQRENNSVAKLLARIPDGASVLDVPFGTGRFVPYYRDRKFDITGVDLSDAMMNEFVRSAGGTDALSALRISLLKADARELDFPDNTFDACVCVRFLQNIVSFGDAKLVLKELARVSKRYVIAEVEMRKSELPPLPLAPTDKPMRTQHNEDQIRQIAQDAGLTIAVIDRIYRKEESDFAVLLCEKLPVQKL
jgi:ubiquinone/menaquinone biosynthesis C-methylase UbiE